MCSTTASREMSRVADDQLDAFRSDPLMTQLAQGMPIRFAGCPHAKEAERRQTLAQSVAQRRLLISFPNQGVNLDLSLSAATDNGTDIQFESALIFNGVCVRVKGRIGRQTLSGQAQLEFDAERAEQEKQRAQRARPHSQRITDLRNFITQ